MNEAEIRFERENLEGLIPVGTYLSNAESRFGIRFKEGCRPAEGFHGCEVEITAGEDLLTDLTSAENAYFKEHGPRVDRRLACQVKIEKSGSTRGDTRISPSARHARPWAPRGWPTRSSTPRALASIWAAARANRILDASRK